jgi:hypothetical protein
MTLDLEFGAPLARYPARHHVVGAMLTRGAERIPVVVKQTRIDWRQRLRGRTKAEQSETTAKALLARGLPTPEPLGIEIREEESWYVARRVEGVQVRQWFLHRDDRNHPPPALSIPLDEVLGALGRLARSLHDSGVFFRDFTDGNILVEGGPGAVRLWLVDLNRVRIHERPIGRWRRLRDLARPGLNRVADRRLLLASYFQPAVAPRTALFAVSLLRARIVFWDGLKKVLRPWKREQVS